MIQKSLERTEKGYRKEEKDFYKGLKKLSHDEVKELIRETINDWEDKEWIFDGYGHSIPTPEMFLERNVPQDVVNWFIRREYGYNHDEISIQGWDEELQKLRPLEPNEYIDGISKYRFVGYVNGSLGLKGSSTIGRGSSCREESKQILEYLNSELEEVK